MSDFSKYLQHPENRRAMSFALRDGGFDTRDHQAEGGAASGCRWGGPAGSIAASGPR